MTRTIANPLPCIRCNYELQGLDESAVCPECGLAAQDSIDGRIHDERLAVIRSSVRTLAWTIGLKSPFTCAGLLAYVVILGVMVAITASTNLAAVLGIVFIALVGAAFAIVIIEWVALYRLTSRAGVRGMTVGRRSDIGFLRAGILAQIIVAPLAALVALGPEPWIAGIIVLGVAVGRFVQFVATCVIYGRLARRLGAESVAKWCFAMAWVIPAVAVFGSTLYGLGGLVAAGLNIATAVRMNNAVAREERRRRHIAAHWNARGGSSGGGQSEAPFDAPESPQAAPHA
jgi:hypothetical protein